MLIDFLLDFIHNKISSPKEDEIYKNLSLKDKKSCEENKIPRLDKNNE